MKLFNIVILIMCIVIGLGQTEEEIVLNKMRRDIVRVTNDVRINKGLRPLVCDSLVSIVAQEHSDELASGMEVDHVGFDQRAQYLQENMKDGLCGIGENEAVCTRDYVDPAHTVMYGGEAIKVDTLCVDGELVITRYRTICIGLVNSPAHYENITNIDHTAIGVGVSIQGNNIYFVQMFIKK